MIRFALLLATAAVPATAVAQAPAAATRPLIQREHISIRDEGGTGPVVILIPGLSSPRAVYDGVVTGLTAKHRVLTVQVNGFGGDDPRANLKPGVLDGIVAELHSHVVAEKLKAPAVVGHSMGGLVAMMLAARHPASVGRLMVVDALPFIGTLFAGPGATVAAIAPQAERMRGMMAAMPVRTDAVTQDPGGIWSITPGGRMQIANWSMKADPRAAAQAMYEDMITDVRPDLAKISAKPFVVLYATGAGPQAEAVWTRDYAGSAATLVPVPGSYHFIMLDQPTEFAKQLDLFLR